MKNVFLLICLTFTLHQAFGKDLKESYPGYTVISDVADDEIEAGYFVVEGKIALLSTGKLVKNVKIEIQNQKVIVSKSGYFELKVPIQSYYVTFSHKSINDAYYENNTPKEKRRIKVIVNAATHTDRIQITEEKPVIYAYSDTTTTFELKLIAKGELTFTYPLLRTNNIWKMNTTSHGNLLSENGLEFPYLFWEAKQEANIQFLQNADVFLGEFLAKNEVLPYLDSVLTYLAFNAKEKTDFITYWGPRLVQKEHCFLQFQTQEVCSQFADYEINPKPTSFNRIYLVFSNFDLMPTNLKVAHQDLKPFPRQGFHLLEWGGIEVNEHDLIKNL